MTTFTKRVNGKEVVRKISHNDFSEKFPQVRVDPRTYQKVMDHLQKSGISYSELTRKMIEGYLAEV